VELEKEPAPYERRRKERGKKSLEKREGELRVGRGGGEKSMPEGRKKGRKPAGRPSSYQQAKRSTYSRRRDPRSKREREGSRLHILGSTSPQ